MDPIRADDDEESFNLLRNRITSVDVLHIGRHTLTSRLSGAIFCQSPLSRDLVNHKESQLERDLFDSQ